MASNFFNRLTVAVTLLILSFLLVRCKKEQQPLNPDFIPAGYKLVWQDEFNGDTLDTAKWQYRGLGPRYNGFNSKEAVSLDGKGNLLLKTFTRNDTTFTGMIGTQSHFQTKYGYFVCRVKLQSTGGNRTAFWLQSATISAGNTSEVDGTEIDVFEYIFAHDHNATCALHWGGYGPNEQTAGPEYTGTVDGYNTFGVLWDANGYKFYVNGINVFNTKQGISNIPEYMILSSEYDASLITVKDFPNILSVDYVRVYQ